MKATDPDRHDARVYTRPFARLLAGLPAHPIIVEVGTAYAVSSENQASCGMSTLAWVEFVQRHGGEVHSIDISLDHLAVCRATIALELGTTDCLACHGGDGELVVQRLVKALPRIDLLYIDGGTGGDKAAAQLRAALPTLRRGAGFVGFDDCASGDPAQNLNPEVRVSEVYRDPTAFDLEHVWTDGICMCYRVHQP